MDEMFRIYERDLVDLERLIPQLVEAMPPAARNAHRAELRHCQLILSSVRWKYADKVRNKTPIRLSDPELDGQVSHPQKG